MNANQSAQQLRLALAAQPATAKALQAITGMPERTVRSYLQMLSQSRQIRPAGRAKTGKRGMSSIVWGAV